MFLEAQFGSDALTPIEIPKFKSTSSSVAPLEDDTGSWEETPEDDMEQMQKNELDRLHKIGIPVPGIEVKVDKMVAKVWLEDLEIECATKAFGERVRAVVERAVEVVAPLWR